MEAIVRLPRPVLVLAGLPKPDVYEREIGQIKADEIWVGGAVIVRVATVDVGDEGYLTLALEHNRALIDVCIGSSTLQHVDSL